MTKTEFEQLVFAARFSPDAEKELERFMDEQPVAYEAFTGKKPHSQSEYGIVSDEIFHGISENHKHEKDGK